MTDKACAVCVKRFETGNARAPLQCRALPPVQDVGLDAVYPAVRPDFYCHTYFEADPTAVKGRKEADAEAARLDGLVAATQAAAAKPAQTELALDPAPIPRDAKPRAPRARAKPAK